MGGSVTDRQLIFVYGTLRADAGGPAQGPRQLLRQKARRVGVGTIDARLYDAGAFPAAVADSEGTVKGEVYALEDAGEVLPALDRYEGCRPEGGGLFHRVERTVEMDSGRSRTAWVYLFNRSVDDLREIESGDFVEGG